MRSRPLKNIGVKPLYKLEVPEPCVTTPSLFMWAHHHNDLYLNLREIIGIGDTVRPMPSDHSVSVRQAQHTEQHTSTPYPTRIANATKEQDHRHGLGPGHRPRGAHRGIPLSLYARLPKNAVVSSTHFPSKNSHP